MHVRALILHIGLTFLITFYFLTCNRLPVTPGDLDYKGEYKLGIALNDSNFYTFFQYRKSFVQGKDEYASFVVFSEPSGAVDSSLFRYNQNDSLTFYFLKPFDGKLCIAASRPNGLIDTFEYEISVKNPFSINGNSFSTKTDSSVFTLMEVEKINASDNVKWVIWFNGNNAFDTLRFNEKAGLVFTKESRFRISASCIDFWENRINLATMNVSTVGPFINFIIDEDTMKAVGDSLVSIHVNGSANKYVWQLDELKPETTSDPVYSKKFFETGSKNALLKVFGIDSLGFRGPADSVILVPADYSYMLRFISSPDSLIIKDTLRWKAGIFKLDGSPMMVDGIYRWIVTNGTKDTLLDSLSTKITGISIVVDDSCVLLLKVKFDDGTGKKIPELSFSDTVKPHRPEITFINPSGPFYSFSSIKIKCVPNEQFRKIKSIHGSFSNKPEKVISDSVSLGNKDTLTFSIIPEIAGKCTLQMWVTDTLGINSKTFLIPLNIIDSRPIVYGIETMPSKIYSKRAVTLTALATAFDKEERLKSYMWSFNGDTIWDTVTNKENISHNFNNDTAEIALRVIDKNDIPSEIYKTGIPVYSGIPIIDSIVLPREKLYIGRSFIVRVFTHNDPAVILDSVKVILKKDTNTYAYASTDMDVKITPDSLTGNFIIYAQVRDTSGLWSEKKDAQKILEINRGEPLVRSVSLIDTAWIKHPAYLNIAVEDPDDLVKRMFISWGDINGRIDTVKMNSSSGLIIVGHTYSNSGFYNLEITAEDTNKLQSVQFSKQIVVHEGKPNVSIAATKYYYSDRDQAYQDTFQNILIGDTLIVPRISYFSGEYSKASYHIRVKAQASDTNGAVINYALKILPPFDTSDLKWQGISEFWFDSIGSCMYLDYECNEFSPDSPAVKTVLYCKDNDGTIGTDTFYIKTDKSPINKRSPQITYPIYGDTVFHSFKVSWIDGVDEEDSMKTNVSVKILYNPFLDKFADSLEIIGMIGAFDRNGDTTSVSVQLPLSGDHAVWNGTYSMEIIITVWDRLRQKSQYYGYYSIYRTTR